MSRPNYLLWTAILLVLCCHSVTAASGHAVEYQVQPKLPNRLQLAEPSQTTLSGWLGRRASSNAEARLVEVGLKPLLAGFQEKPGSHPWIGEHIGKWMHAATLAWANNHDFQLRKKLDVAVKDLIAAQEPDGYLGTYVPAQRFGLHKSADWDVWSHKYCMLGLLTYYQYTGETNALAASVKAADLLIRTFGPNQKSILAAGTHVGMAATSVLEPVVLLYRLTGESRYLDFAKYIILAWSEPGGPRLMESLSDHGQVNKAGNAKAYEMLSNLVGACDLAQITGDTNLLRIAVQAARDIREKRLYITGSASQGEHFHPDYYLPNDSSAHIAETCVTVTWLQLNSRLLQLTGEAVYGDSLEQTFFNHLTAAQHPNGKQWCYYTPLNGRKEYGPGISCCVSSGPRGISMVPQHAFLIEPGTAGKHPTVLVNLIDDAEFEHTFGSETFALNQRLRFQPPDLATITYTIAHGQGRFALAVRRPGWGKDPQIVLPDGTKQDRSEQGWMRTQPRLWKAGEQAVLTFRIATELLTGTHGNTGLCALTWGPLVLAYDQQQSGTGEHPATVAFASPADPAAALLRDPEGLKFQVLVRSGKDPQPHPAVFVPYADAGKSAGRFAVWLPAPGSKPLKVDSLALHATEDRSRPGNLQGSITDDDPDSIAVTFDGHKRREDWYSLVFDEPVTASEIVFVHGRNFHDGGWFDASERKPRVEVQRAPGAKWELIGTLLNYPATTATDPKNLIPGQRFSLKLSEPLKLLGVRVLGKPACGDSPDQSFSSCAEIQVVPAR